MKYVISDIHGCYDEYIELLEKIRFSDTDELYVLGDSIDRGPEPIRVIQDMIMRRNVFYIVGNHDYMMLKVLKKLVVEITEDNFGNYLTVNDMLDYTHWMLDGGKITSKQFRRLSRKEQRDVLEYLEEASVYETIEEGNKLYILVHAGIHGFEIWKGLDEYDFIDFIFTRTDYGKQYFEGDKTFLITGHTPTMNIHEDKQPVVYCKNGHIAIDCGCVFGGNLAAYCIETGDVTYVKSKIRAKDAKRSKA